ncbi:hypothetical protein DVY91_06860 [Enterococcus faecalis]|uniref:Uncharacterized protein n=1 Tax=Enterococcus faecalis TaxID=1351 RepID=A0A2S7M3B3_ENTFL|nr:hypothetical protein CEQ16_02965 [Enterococcus faecalis]AUC57053.1 hypothetical protein CG806_01160 [Enterococcus faecalis ARO1/DG]AZV35294.1 hypothetical protein CVT43_00215 [Enterococcus faecalis OG1RF]EEU17189.1 predicted protein [Enterococcus faecalis ATCC 4200]EFM78423.1 hypothetical protein HMPREF9514_02797 [Enterococcus faecalis TX0855]EFU15305.1 hypothetical protein HMPREF9518_00863 [Enterococcus faecalis TX1342]EJV28378.1 hypothetical protein HMPREF1339_00637 [Enterococcus faecali
MSGFGEKSNRRRRQALTVSRQELVLVKKSGTTHGRLLSNVFLLLKRRFLFLYNRKEFTL